MFKIILLTAFAVLINNLNYVTCDCILQPHNFVAAFQKIGGQLVQVSKIGLINMKPNTEFTIICPSGFQFINNYTPLERDTIYIRCSVNGEIKYEGHNFRTDMYNQPEVMCSSFALGMHLSDTNTSSCAFTSYAIGFKVGTEMYTFMESCFNAFKMNVEYVHFIIKAKTNVLSLEDNVVQVHPKSSPTDIPASIFFETSGQLTRRLNASFNNINIESMYEFSDLIPPSFLPSIKEQFDQFSNINRAIWLKSLKNGASWNMYMRLLSKRGEEVEYDAYLGTSKSSKPLPKFFQACEDAYTEKKHVELPDYIWSYLISRDKKEEIIVVGVNTPFLDFNEINETVFCDDICKSIDWLAPIEEYRQMPNMGYLFCCSPTPEVKLMLHGLPTF